MYTEDLFYGARKPYYVDDNPIASDEEYDRLYHEILKFEKENPDKIASNSPTKRVGGEVREEFKKASHIKPMWSMEDIFSSGEFKEWIERIFHLGRVNSFVSRNCWCPVLNPYLRIGGG